MDKYALLKEIGTGKFGAVYLAECIGSSDGCSQQVAIKTTRKAKDGVFDVQSKSKTKEIRRECRIHEGLVHPNVIRLIERLEGALVLEYAPVEMFELLQNRGRFSEASACKYVLGVCEGLKYLHSKFILHRDIKPENLLISNSVVKIADFGLSKKCSGAPMRADTICGTNEYLPPEMVREVLYDHRVDIWTVGVLMFEFLAGISPFVAKSKKKTFGLINKCKYEFPGWFSEDARRFISGILQILPNKRKTLAELVQDPWACRMASECVSDETLYSDSESESSDSDEPGDKDGDDESS
jgi:serine/threonine protein kinase